MIQIGDQLPAATLYEYIVPEDGSCAIGPTPVQLPQALKGKTIAIVAVPGAFTPTCSERHLPGYIEHAQALREAGVDEIWCVAVNDAFVMGAWGHAQKVGQKVRMLGDGSADFARATGLTLELSARGLGLRSNRFSMLVRDGRVLALNVEEAGKFEVSDAATLLAQARAL